MDPVAAPEIDAAGAQTAVRSGAPLLDVREPNEWSMGHIPGALHIPRGVMESAIESRVPRDQEVVIYCASGNRSAMAADILQQMGYQKVSSMRGGIRGWADMGGDVEA